MNATLRKDGSLYIRMHDDDSIRKLDNGFEAFLSPDQVEMIRFELNKKVP